MGRAFREGKGVIRSDATSEAERRGTTAASVLLDVPAPPLTLDIFSKFQQRREDFDANWILAEEDPQDAAAAAAPPIHALLKAKLKDQANEFQKDRKRRRDEVEASEEEEDEEEEKKHRKRTEKKEEEMAAHPGPSPPLPSRSTSHKRRHPKEEEEEDDAEYNPEEKVVTVSSSTTPLADPLGGERQGKPPKKENEKEGLQGEFICFVANTPASGGSITSEDLVVRMAPFPSPPPPHSSGREETPKDDDAAEQKGLTGGGRRRLWPSRMEEEDDREAYSVERRYRQTKKEDDDAEATEAFYAKFSTPSHEKGGNDLSTPTAVSNPHRSPRPPPPPPPLHGKPTGMAMPLWSSRRIQEVGAYCDAMLHPTIALHQEVMDLVAFLRPTLAEVCVRRYIAEEVERMAQSLWPASHAVVFGSLRTGLLLPLSDVDLTLANVPLAAPDDALPKLAQVIDAAKFTSGRYPQVILKTKVPLIKFQHAHSEVEVDISLAAMDGTENTSIVRDLLCRYPEAHSLIIVIKYFLQQRDMNDPYTGGLGSYATTLLVISFLQHHPIYSTHPEERSCTGLGKLLVDFFRYYGLYWNFNRCRVSVQNGGSYTLRTHGDSSFPFGRHGSPISPISPTSPSSPTNRTCQLEVEDPGNVDNNAASSVRQFHTISSFFTHAYLALTANGVGVPSSPRFWEDPPRADGRSPHAPPPSSTSGSGESGRYASGSGSYPLSSSSSSSSSFSSSPSLSPTSFFFRPPVEAIAPDAADIRLRPTLLSRILHVDPESLQRRRCVEAAYQQLCQKEPTKMTTIRMAVEKEEADEKARVRRDVKGAVWSGGGGTSSSSSTSPSTGSLLDRLRAAAREQRPGAAAAPHAPPLSPISLTASPVPSQVRTADEEASISHLASAVSGGVGGEKERERKPCATPHPSLSETAATTLSSSSSSSQEEREREESRMKKERLPWGVDVEAEGSRHAKMEAPPLRRRQSRSPRPLSSSSRANDLSERNRHTEEEMARRSRSPPCPLVAPLRSPVASSPSHLASSRMRGDKKRENGNESGSKAMDRDFEERDGLREWEGKKRGKQRAEKREGSRSSSESGSRESSSSHSDSISTDVVKRIERRNKWRKGSDSQKKKNNHK